MHHSSIGHDDPNRYPLPSPRPLAEVWSVMKERRLKSIPIADQEVRQLGVLNARNALRALLQEVEYEEILLRETRAFAARASPRRRYAT